MRHVIDRSVSSGFDSVFDNGSETLSGSGLHSLRRILPAARFFAGSDIEFQSIAVSAEQAEAGDLVVYRIGEQCPSRLVADAMARGAAGIITEQVLPCPLPQCIVGDVELAVAEISATQLGRPDRQLLTIGVVGSAGKTSTALMIASLFRGEGIRTAYQTDLGESDGVVQSTSDCELPVTASLVQWFAEAKDCGSRVAIVECDDEPARRGGYDAIQFDLLVVTGSIPANSDFGESGLQCLLERLTSTGVVIAPSDDARATRIIRDYGARMVTYGVRGGGDVTAKIIDQSGGMTTLLLSHEEMTVAMETNLCGAAMAANHAAATAVGVLIETPLHRIAERLGKLRCIPGCGQAIHEIGKPTVVLDRAGTPERAAAALRTYRSMKSNGRLWCILAIDDKQSNDDLARLGHQMERFADHAIVTASEGCKGGFLAASHSVMDGVQHCAAMRLVADRGRAIEWAIAEAKENDTVLILGGLNGRTPLERRSEIETLAASIKGLPSPAVIPAVEQTQSDAPATIKIEDYLEN